MLKIISCGLSKETITPIASEIVKNSKVLYGGKRLLDIFPDFNGELNILDSNFFEKVEEILKRVKKNEDITLLASGDALFFGVAKRFLSHLTKEQITIYPNISAMQTLFARIAINWENAKFYSIHGRNEHLPWVKILNQNIAVIYADNKKNAADIAKELIEKFPDCETRNAVIAENLGLDNEKIVYGTLQELAQKQSTSLSILCLLPCEFSKKTARQIGFSDEQYEKENNLITHSEIRAIVLSKLKLRGGVMWDLGAGSGSVGIEVANFCNDITVFSVEKNKDRCEIINKNIANFATDNCKSINDDILNQIQSLPNPSAVFVGGGGADISQIIMNSFDKLEQGGIIVATAILLETKVALGSILKDKCKEVVSVSINRAIPLAGNRFMKSDNTIDIFVFEK